MHCSSERLGSVAFHVKIQSKAENANIIWRSSGSTLARLAVNPLPALREPIN